MDKNRQFNFKKSLLINSLFAFSKIENNEFSFRINPM